jgi:hypothetical protein
MPIWAKAGPPQKQMETTATMNNGLMRTPRISRLAAPEIVSA